MVKVVGVVVMANSSSNGQCSRVLSVTKLAACKYEREAEIWLHARGWGLPLSQ